jgi:hypothetical protein
MPRSNSSWVLLYLAFFRPALLWPAGALRLKSTPIRSRKAENDPVPYPLLSNKYAQKDKWVKACIFGKRTPYFGLAVKPPVPVLRGSRAPALAGRQGGCGRQGGQLIKNAGKVSAFNKKGKGSERLFFLSYLIATLLGSFDSLQNFALFFFHKFIQADD